MQVNIPERQLILSEAATMVEELAASLNKGDVVEGIVTRVVDYGAFVSLRSPDGGMHGAVVRSPSHPSPCCTPSSSGKPSLLLLRTSSVINSPTAACTALWWAPPSSQSPPA